VHGVVIERLASPGIDGMGGELLVEVRPQSGTKEGGAHVEVRGQCIRARPSSRLVENKIDVCTGDSVIVLLPLEPDARRASVIIFRERGRVAP
jgi:hypothetical protein